MSIRNLGLVGASVLVALALFLFWHWRPERQVRLHQQNFLSALEDRDWGDVAKLIADNYSDRWGHDKGFVLRESREVFRQFIAVQVLGEIIDLQVADGAGEVKARVEMKGRGGPVAEFAITKVNALREPWLFRWERKSAKPWDWKLVRVDQPELDIDMSQWGGGGQ